MTTKSGNLSLKEKQRIEELLKCQREKKRLHIVVRLSKLREVIEAPYNTEIEELQRKAESIRQARELSVIQSGYGKIRERGCYDTHPDLDKFDAETNKILIDLWKTSEAKEEQFIES